MGRGYEIQPDLVMDTDTDNTKIPADILCIRRKYPDTKISIHDQVWVKRFFYPKGLGPAIFMSHG